MTTPPVSPRRGPLPRRNPHHGGCDAAVPTWSGVRAGSGGLAVVLTALMALAPAPATAQETDPLVSIPQGEEGWNTERAKELVSRAQQRRRQPVADSALRNYRADVSGHIYFFIDREAEPEPVLLRADQVALELYWAQPNLTKQVIRGMRSEEQFPIKDFRYYIDRYTVIQNGFDDQIRIGEGRDVRSVIHPLAPEGQFLYDFRLADSTTIRLPGEPDPIRVYEIQVRPRNFDLPGIVGSLYVERARGDLVRLAFTFTPASYRDPRNERVEVMLENALWEGRYWLPREQRLLVRREIPELDLDVGTVIRGGLRVSDYDFNLDLPDSFFRGAEVVMAAGPERLADYDFEEGLLDGFDDVGLEGAEPGTLDAVDVDAIAGRILRERFLRGIPRVRLFAPAVSDILRYDRTEGLVAGLGASYGIGRSQLYGHAAWAFGAGHPVATAGWKPAGPETGRHWWVEGYLNRPADIGLRPAAAGVVSSLSAALLGWDLRDVYPATGARLGWETGSARDGRWAVSLGVERRDDAGRAVASAPFDEERLFRPPPPVDVETDLALELRNSRRGRLGPFELQVAPSLTAHLQPSAGCAIAEPAPDDGTDAPTEPDAGPDAEPDADAWWTGTWCRDPVSLRLRLDVNGAWLAPDLRTGAESRLTLAHLVGDPGREDLLYVGGPNTLPGHPARGYVGTSALLADVVLWRDLVPRLLRLRLLAAAGWTGPEDLESFALVDPPGLRADPWNPAPTPDLKASVGAGFGLLDGVVRLDWVFRTDTGEGSLLLSTDPRLWSFL